MTAEQEGREARVSAALSGDQLIFRIEQGGIGRVGLGGEWRIL